MKKTILMLAVISFSIHGWAQESNIINAKESLTRDSLADAKEYIDLASVNPQTKGKPKTLFVTAQVYMALQTKEKYKNIYAYRTATEAMLRLMEIKPDYEKGLVHFQLAVAAIYYYNDGAVAYNNKMMEDASKYMAYVVKIHDMTIADHFREDIRKNIDDLALNAKQVLSQTQGNGGVK